MLRLNKYFCLFWIFIILPSYLFASNCNKRAFDINIDNEDTSSYEIINQLSKVCNFSVVYKDSFSKTTLQAKNDGFNIKNMHLNDVFDLLISENGLSYDYSGRILRIKGLETKTFKVDYITSIRKGSAITKANVESKGSSDGDSGGGSSDSDNVIETQEEFDFWKNISQEISNILSSSSLDIPVTPPTVNSNAGLVTVTSNKETLDKVEEYLNRVQNSLKKQVVIDVSIVEVKLNKSHKNGVDWSQFSLGLDTFGLGGKTGESGKIEWDYANGSLKADNPFASASGLIFRRGQDTQRDFYARLGLNVSGMINFLKESGDAKVISSPKVVALNNQQALITVGDTYNYKLKGSKSQNESGGTNTESEEEKSIFVGILLNILPEISEDNKIMLRINPSISELLLPEDKIKSKDSYREIAPDTTQKKLSTVVQVEDGDTIVLGGLITDGQNYKRNGVPFLQDIPLFGNLFGSKQKVKERKELVFLLTPRIVDLSKKDNDVKKSLADLGYEIALDYDKDLIENATKDEISNFKSKKKTEVEFDSVE